MLSSLQTIVALVVALLPGAHIVWACERTTGQRYGVGSRDRLLRFVGRSAFHSCCLLDPFVLALFELLGGPLGRDPASSFVGFRADRLRCYSE